MSRSREEIAAELRAAGWSERNIERIVGETAIPSPPASEPRALKPPVEPRADRPVRRLELLERPRLYRGAGDRRDDCVEYADCLKRLLDADRNAPDAHCPPFCKHYEATPAHVRHEVARVMGGARHALAGRWGATPRDVAGDEQPEDDDAETEEDAG